MFVGRFWCGCGGPPVEEVEVEGGGVRSTSWMCPGERPGKANNDRPGEGERTHNPMYLLERG